MSFTAITLEAALAIEPTKLSGVIDGIPVNPANPPASDIKHDERETEEMILWWRQPYLEWDSGGRWEVRCLDGGAWDRPTFIGSHEELASAIELAKKPTRAYAIGEMQALENGEALMRSLGVNE
ncbi:hypothetical protein E4188_23095 (plasmid) [Aeromonas media]|uniref:DUF2591 domain-containing protein n=2 Tax=Aeromonas TaxID=642 RepID=A0ABX6NYC4_AERME|nr:MULTISPECIES: hypothetical protein [Aeromonas]ASI21406.1 hypothetical protein CE456_00755 [Aeromonas salmonicida]QJT41388.1 hypothetical protein E4188_23095 [Aeromonas media]QLI59222.1 hypothetical protein C0708_23085 [Aeromonas caviae]QLI60452.1 hypothetical protein C1C91_22735 [Aeromonas caviae]HDN9374627.1 hypothetical protein [Aeromonas salmonicida]